MARFHTTPAHQIPQTKVDLPMALSMLTLADWRCWHSTHLLMQDMRHFLPDYLHEIYLNSRRGEDDLRVQICQSFKNRCFA